MYLYFFNSDKQAIDSIKAAISKPRNPSFPLVECEFPPLDALNKLGDGSQRSADQVDNVSRLLFGKTRHCCCCPVTLSLKLYASIMDLITNSPFLLNPWTQQANFEFAAKLVKSLSWLPFGSPNVYLVLSAAASSRVIKKAQNIIKGATFVGSLKDGVPDTLKEGDIVVVVSPCVAQDYQMASQIAKNGVASSVVLINGLAKVSRRFCDVNLGPYCHLRNDALTLLYC